MKNPKLRTIRKRARRDNRGYTLQTVIVMSILIAAAVGASVVLYRAVSSNTDARSVTDLAGSNAPSRPHGFSVERTTAIADEGGADERTVPSATVRWSPPLYTGQPELEGTPASLLYKVDYGCGIPGTGDIPSELDRLELDNIPENPTDLTGPSDPANVDESKLGIQAYYSDSTGINLSARESATELLDNLFPNTSPPPKAHCILQAQAYTCSDAQTEDCANPDDTPPRALTGQEIYSLESDPIRFELNRAPSELQTPAATVQYRSPTQNRVDLSWETPAYTGAGEAHLYRIQWQQRDNTGTETDFDADGFSPTDTPQCTVGNTHSIVLTFIASTDAVDFHITPYAVTAAEAAAAVPPAFTCPASFASAAAGTSTLRTGIHLLATQPASVPSPTLDVSIPTSENILPAATDSQKRTALDNLYVNVQAEIAALTVPKTLPLGSYELRWSRADGGSTPNTRVIPAPTSTTDTLDSTKDIYPASTVTLNLENDKAYNFSLTANFDNDETRQVSICAVIYHSQRTPAPDLEVIPISGGLRIRISPHNQTNFCNGPVTALSSPTTPAPTTQHYKVRVYSPASTCTGDYPDEQCTDVYNQCIAATTGTTRPSAEEVVETGLTAGTSYEVEVIAGHNCDATAKTIGFATPTSPYGYPSAPIVKSATPLATSTAPSAPTGVSATFMAADPPSNPDRWNLSWEIVPGSIGYLFTWHHDSADSTDATRYAYVPSSRATSFSAPAPINPFTCSKSSATLSCIIPDDGNTSTDFTATVQAVSSSGVSTATSVTTAQP